MFSLVANFFATRFLLLTAALVFLLNASTASAQIAYFNNVDGELWQYNLDTHAKTYIGILQTFDNPQPLAFTDIASDYKGELYGIAMPPGQTQNMFYKIDRTTALATKLFSVDMKSRGLTFTPDGKFYGTGSPSPLVSQGFYELIPNFIAKTMSYTLIKNFSGQMAVDDVGFDQIDQKFYVASHNTPNQLLEVVSGQNVAALGVNNTRGFDFYGYGQGEKAFSCAENVVYHLDRSGNFWNVTGTDTIGTAACWGATKYHCTALKPSIMLNHAIVPGPEPKEVHLPCGSPAFLSTDIITKKHAKYRWTFSGNDLSGTPQSVVIEGTGQVETIDLISDPRLSALQVSTVVSGSQRVFKARLETWCDLYEKCSPPGELLIYVDPISPQLWEITPESLKDGTADYTYTAGTETEFRDLGTADLKSQQWFVDAQFVGTANPQSKKWSAQDVGMHVVMHEVTHQNSCISRESRTLEILPSRFFVPSVFSPNGDGLNDTFSPVFSETPDQLDILIFNRWGQEVFSGTRANYKWDGTFNNQPVEIGTYGYLIRYRLIGSNEYRMLKGDVTVTR